MGMSDLAMVVCVAVLSAGCMGAALDSCVLTPCSRFLHGGSWDHDFRSWNTTRIAEHFQVENFTVTRESPTEIATAARGNETREASRYPEASLFTLRLSFSSGNQEPAPEATIARRANDLRDATNRSAREAFEAFAAAGFEAVGEPRWHVLDGFVDP